MAQAATRKHAGREHHRGGHPLSSKLAADHEGWTEGLTGLTDEHSATQLLAEAPPMRTSGGAAGIKVGVRGRCAGALRHGRGGLCRSWWADRRLTPCNCAALPLQAPAAAPAAAPPPAGPAGGEDGGAAPSSLSPEEERRARLEHALKALEVEVLQRGEVLADLGGWLALCSCGVACRAGVAAAGAASLHSLCPCSSLATDPPTPARPCRLCPRRRPRRLRAHGPERGPAGGAAGRH